MTEKNLEITIYAQDVPIAITHFQTSTGNEQNDAAARMKAWAEARGLDYDKNRISWDWGCDIRAYHINHVPENYGLCEIEMDAMRGKYPKATAFTHIERDGGACIMTVTFKRQVFTTAYLDHNGGDGITIEDLGPHWC